MINNTYKIQLIQDRIDLINLHVKALEDDIAENPMGDDPNKPTRQSVLDDFLVMIDALKAEQNELGSDIIEGEE